MKQEIIRVSIELLFMLYMIYININLATKLKRSKQGKISKNLMVNEYKRNIKELEDTIKKLKETPEHVKLGKLSYEEWILTI